MHRCVFELPGVDGAANLDNTFRASICIAKPGILLGCDAALEARPVLPIRVRVAPRLTPKTTGHQRGPVLSRPLRLKDLRQHDRQGNVVGNRAESRRRYEDRTRSRTVSDVLVEDADTGEQAPPERELMWMPRAICRGLATTSSGRPSLQNCPENDLRLSYRY